MSSKKEEERNEKIIRGLMKLPPNRRCINCDSLGPQYVCTNFWTFICMTCSGIHREFTHRVKSVSMSKFSSQEVDALQRGGNQRAREIFLKNWDMQHRRLPNSSNAEKIREFIKMVYVDKKYAGTASSDKPPRDILSSKNSEEDGRKASSYHSYSQSPPYDHQYEDRLYGKQTGILNRRHGSDRIHYDEKFSNIIYSPGHRVEQMYEDRFANEGSAPRFSDFSVSSAGDTFRYDGQSPSFEKDTGYISPSVQSTRDISIGDANIKSDVKRIPRPHRAASSGSFGSFDSNSASLKSVGSSSILDISLDSEQHTENSQPEVRVHSASPPSSAYAPSVCQDPFGLQCVQSLPGSSAQCIDLFATNTLPFSLANSSDKKPASISSESEGWATFDMPKDVESTSEAKKIVFAATSGNEIAHKSFDVHFSANNNSLWHPMQISRANDSSMSMTNQWNPTSLDATLSSGLSIPQPWNAFDDFSVNSASTSFFDPPKVEPQTSNPAVPTVVEPSSESKLITPWNAFNKYNVNSASTSFFDPLKVEPQTSNPAVPTVVKPSSESKLITTDLQGSCSHGGAVVLYMPSEDALNESSVSLPTFPLMGGSTLERKTTNPFDLPDGTDFEMPSTFLDMNYLQGALPSPQIPSSYISNIEQPWFPENPVPPYMPSGGMALVEGQASGSQLQNLSSQGHASRGGNPFA